LDEIKTQNLYDYLGVAKPAQVKIPDTPSLITQQTKPVTDVFEYLQIPREPPEEKVFSKEDVLASPEDMSAIRKMMVTSKGTDYKDKPDEEVYDDFLSHMRWMSTNEVYTVKEAMDVFGSDDESKAAYGRAYEVYDKVGNIFGQGGGGILDKGRGVLDYGQAILTSPSTWAGLIVGRAASKAATKGLQTKVIAEISEAAAKQVGLKGGKTAALTAKREVANAALKVNTKIATAAALAVEAPLAGIQDKLYQDIMIETGAQGEFSVAQSAIATILGGSGAISSYLVNKGFKGSSGLADTGSKIKESKVARKAKSKKVLKTELPAAIKAANADWLKLAKEGTDLDGNKKLREAVVGWFTDYKNDGGFVSILQKAGADLDIESSGGFSRSLVNFAEELDEETKDALTEAFKPLGVTFGQVIQAFAATTREGGQNAQLLSSASKFWDNFKNITVANRQAAQGVVAEFADDALDNSMDANSLGYIQSVWKRMIVSHPGTTALNVKGWGFSMAGRSFAEAIQMSTLYGSAGIQALMGKSSDITLSQAKALRDNLLYMNRIAIDPFTTVEGFYKLLEEAPKKIQGKVVQQFFQGVDNRGAAAFGLNPNARATKFTEKLTETAQRLSLVNAQDVMTKSFSGIKELDKQVRLKHNIGLSELLNQKRAYEISDEMWEKAVTALQEDTFSVDFRGTKGIMGKFAQISQDLSNMPGVGFIYPFGQFVNSVIAFSYRYSPMGLISNASRMYKDPSMDIGTKVAQGVVGTTAWALAYIREQDKAKEGLQWFEERDSTGAVYKVDNLFPVGLYNVIGRLLVDNDPLSPDDGGSKDLWTALGQQLAAPAALAEFGKFAPVIDMINYFTDPATPESEKSSLLDIVGYAVEAISGIAAGFTRPIDPLNDAFGIMMDMNGEIDFVNVDKKQAQGIDAKIQNLGRYTDAFFSFVMGEPNEDGARLFGVAKQSATQSGPVESGNPGAGIFGTQYQQRRTPIDKLLGMVNKAPFRVDSFTTGVPQYDNWMNEVITPILEREANALLSSEAFQKMSMSAKIDVVERMLDGARKEVLTSLEGIGPRGKNETLLNERRKLMSIPRAARARAKSELNIATPDHKLNMVEIELIRKKIELEREMFGDVLGE